MIIHNLNIDWTTIRPREADAELIIDPDAIPTLSVTTQLLQAVSGRRPHVLNRRGPVQLIQLPPRDPPQVRWADLGRCLRPYAVVNVTCRLVSVGLDHVYNVYRYTL